MGQAKQRGTRAERIAQSIERHEAEEAAQRERSRKAHAEHLARLEAEREAEEKARAERAEYHARVGVTPRHTMRIAAIVALAQMGIVVVRPPGQ